MTPSIEINICCAVLGALVTVKAVVEPSNAGLKVEIKKSLEPPPPEPPPSSAIINAPDPVEYLSIFPSATPAVSTLARSPIFFDEVTSALVDILFNFV